MSKHLTLSSQDHLELIVLEFFKFLRRAVSKRSFRTRTSFWGSRGEEPTFNIVPPQGEKNSSRKKFSSHFCPSSEEAEMTSLFQNVVKCRPYI